MRINRELYQQMFQQRENQMQHLEYNREFQYYRDISSGDVEKVKQYFMKEDEQAYSDRKHGRLSKDPLKNAQYHFVVSVALITRICAEHGLERETAYTLSDLYIQKMDEQKEIKQIAALHNAMILDFTQLMQQVQQKNIYSIHVIKACSYISAHLHEKLHTQTISDALSLNRSYLSALFHKETGYSLHDYIMMQKIQGAARLLTTSEMTSAEIAEYYSFSSQSQFIKHFQKYFGKTPALYRKNFYQSSGLDDQYLSESL